MGCGLQTYYQDALVHRRRMLQIFDTSAFIASYACRSRLTTYVIRVMVSGI